MGVSRLRSADRRDASNKKSALVWGFFFTVDRGEIGSAFTAGSSRLKPAREQHRRRRRLRHSRRDDRGVGPRHQVVTIADSRSSSCCSRARRRVVRVLRSDNSNASRNGSGKVAPSASSSKRRSKRRALARAKEAFPLAPFWYAMARSSLAGATSGFSAGA